MDLKKNQFLGALVFGFLGDKFGRKKMFLLTISIMGTSTCLVGLLPAYSSIQIFAPVILISLRCLQGFAVGGEYGGAVIYVAEFAPLEKRGLYTSFIQSSLSSGLLLSLVVIILCNAIFGEANFKVRHLFYCKKIFRF